MDETAPPASCFKFEARPSLYQCFEFEASYTRCVPAALDPRQLAAYFALVEVSGLLKHAVERHLRVEGAISYVQFEILTRLFSTPTAQQRMTDLADGIVHSRSGLTYQAEQLEDAGLISRAPGVDDERSTVVTLSAAGRALVERLLPGHVQLVQSMLFDHLSPDEVTLLTDVLGRVRDELRSAPPRSAAPRSRHRS
jgi:DNA-binding MarR family transcriptional regulator